MSRRVRINSTLLLALGLAVASDAAYAGLPAGGVHFGGGGVHFGGGGGNFASRASFGGGPALSSVGHFGAGSPSFAGAHFSGGVSHLGSGPILGGTHSSAPVSGTGSFRFGSAAPRFGAGLPAGGFHSSGLSTAGSSHLGSSSALSTTGLSTMTLGHPGVAHARVPSFYGAHGGAGFNPGHFGGQSSSLANSAQSAVGSSPITRMQAGQSANTAAAAPSAVLPAKSAPIKLNLVLSQMACRQSSGKPGMVFFSDRGLIDDDGPGAFGGGTPPGVGFDYPLDESFSGPGAGPGPTFGPAPSGVATGTAPATTVVASTSPAGSSPASSSSASTSPASGSDAAAKTVATREELIKNGEAAFRQADYRGAIDHWLHALADNPRDPLVAMMLGQAYFAAGDYRAATVTTQAAMHVLPKEKWGVIVGNLNDLYSDPSLYTRQLEDLELAVEDQPRDPAQHFLLGYQYAYLDYPRAAVSQLDRVIALEPRDELAAELRSHMLPRLPDPQAPRIMPGQSVLTAYP